MKITLLFFPLSLPSRLIFGTLYPAYSSYKAVKSKDIKEYVSSTFGGRGGGGDGVRWGKLGVKCGGVCGTDALFRGYWEAGQYGDLLGVTQASSPG